MHRIAPTKKSNLTPNVSCEADTFSCSKGEDPLDREWGRWWLSIAVGPLMQQSAQDGERGIKDTSTAIGVEQDKLKGRFVSKWGVLTQWIGCGCHPLHAWWHHFHLMKWKARASISWRWEVSAGQTSGKWWRMGGWLIGDLLRLSIMNLQWH